MGKVINIKKHKEDKEKKKREAASTGIINQKGLYHD